MDTYRPERDVSPRFYAEVAAWLGDSGEVLVLLRYLRGGGAMDYALCYTVAELEAIVDAVPIGTDIEVFRDAHLPLRGIVSADFMSIATKEIADGQAYLVITMATDGATKISLLGDIGESHAELLEFLEECMDQQVALGPCPEFNREDHDGLVSVAKGGIDGPR